MAQQVKPHKQAGPEFDSQSPDLKSWLVPARTHTSYTHIHTHHHIPHTNILTYHTHTHHTPYTSHSPNTTNTHTHTNLGTDYSR